MEKRWFNTISGDFLSNMFQEFYQYSRMQLGLDPLHLAVLPDRTQFLVAVPPVSRYPWRQVKVQWDPAALLGLVQEMFPCVGADRDGEQVATRTQGLKLYSVFLKALTLCLPRSPICTSVKMPRSPICTVIHTPIVHSYCSMKRFPLFLVRTVRMRD